jgi:hypothetical protein
MGPGWSYWASSPCTWPHRDPGRKGSRPIPSKEEVSWGGELSRALNSLQGHRALQELSLPSTLQKM